MQLVNGGAGLPRPPDVPHGYLLLLSGELQGVLVPPAAPAASPAAGCCGISDARLPGGAVADQWQ